MVGNFLFFWIISRIFGTQRLSPGAGKRRPDVAHLPCCLDRGGLEPPTLGSFGSLPRARRAFVPTELPAHDPQNLVSSYLLWEISSVSLRGRVVKLRCWRCGGIHRWKGEGKMRAFVQLALSISLSRWFYSSPATPCLALLPPRMNDAQEVGYATSGRSLGDAHVENPSRKDQN